MDHGAAIYARTNSDAGNHTSQLVAKSRLAPRKTACFRRLELFSIGVGCKLLKGVLKSIQTLQFVVDVSACSDSTIALAWIRSTPNRYSIFVATSFAKFNRCYQPTNENIFRLIKPGRSYNAVSAAELQNLQVWWSEPSWLQTNEVSIPLSQQLVK